MTQAALNSLPWFPGMPQMVGLTCPRVSGVNLPSGVTSLYTVPAGRKALVCQSSSFNVGVSNIFWSSQVDTGFGSANLTFRTTNVNSQLTSLEEGFVLFAGWQLKVNPNNAGLNVNYKVLEFDDSVPFVMPFVFTFSAGDTNIYTVPAGKRALLMNYPLEGVGSGMNPLMVASYAVQSFKWYIVPSGQSVGTQYQLSEAVAAGVNNRVSLTFAPVSLDAGDSLVINSTVGNYLAWVTAFEY